MLLSQHELPGSFSGPGLLFPVPETWLFTYFASISWADSQGLFPRLENVAAFKKVSVVPTQRRAESQPKALSVRALPHPGALGLCLWLVPGLPLPVIAPTYTNLFSAGLQGCIIRDQRDLSPNSHNHTASFIFEITRVALPLLLLPGWAASFV